MIAAAQPSSLIQQDILPVAIGYALIMGALAAGLLLLRRLGGSAAPAIPREPGTAGGERAPVPAAAPPDRRGWLRLIRHWVTTAVGGYLLLMAVLIAYYFGVVHVGGNFIESAFTGCALLLGLSSPVFLAASWVSERRSRRRRGSGAPSPPSPAGRTGQADQYPAS
ncbi:MAG: hypothetical protein JO242_04780 [Streptosporangiaceae bacterium]|nr:hypothetical protein [Streptosporangiaceae bacterium]